MLGLAAFSGVLIFAGLWFCPFALLFHAPCPACGLTRATRALAHCDLASAVRFHPLAPVAVPALALYIAAEMYWEIVHGGSELRPPWRKHTERFFGALVIAGALVWAARFFGAFGGPVPV